MDHDYVDDDDAFAEVVEDLVGTPVYALDTEFHRERTYFPRIALLQLRWNDRLVLVDPIVVDLAPLAKVLDGDGVAVIHAAGQDLEVLHRACGTIPAQLFDTQIAAGFVGMRSPSLAALHERLLGERLAKGDRLTDWLRRPLEPSQLRYAAADVDLLLDIHDHLVTALDERGRTEWAAAECELLRSRAITARDPADAWLRIKESRHLKGTGRSVARSVAEWRERVATVKDIPPRFVLSDLAVVAIAQQAPTSTDELLRIRGVEERQARSSHGAEILEAVAAGTNAEVPSRPRVQRSGDQASLRPAASLLSAWVAQHAHDLDLDPALLGTRSDIEALLRGEPSRLTEGWRAELAGEPIRRLISGDASLAFAGAGRLLLEERSGTAIVTDHPPAATSDAG